MTLRQTTIPILLITLALCACHKTPQSTAKRYPFTGRVTSIDKPSKSLVIDGDDVPGFMSAMTMTYPVNDATILDKVAPGDQIKAEVVVDGEKYWLENLTITQHSTTPPPKPTATLHIPAPGDQVPNFRLINQDGKSISLNQYRGKTLILTFIYTRCPFPDFCPRVSHEFAGLDRQLHSDTALYNKTHLLSISFDPAHDTPKVLRDYGFSCSGSRQPAIFNHWEFAVTPAKDLPEIANFFGLEYNQDGALLTHSLSTAVIGPDGRIVKWYFGSDWQAVDLLKDATDAVHAAS
ncbi:MAG: SCO family protein [Terriglobales bacterium]